MSTVFPTQLDAFTNPTGQTPTNSSVTPHAEQHSNANDAIEALQAKVGIDNSSVTTSIDYKLRQKPTVVSAPTTATQIGAAGQIAYDATHFYVCVATNTWVRSTLTTW